MSTEQILSMSGILITCLIFSFGSYIIAMSIDTILKKATKELPKKKNYSLRDLKSKIFINGSNDKEDKKIYFITVILQSISIVSALISAVLYVITLILKIELIMVITFFVVLLYLTIVSIIEKVVAHKVEVTNTGF